MQASITRNAGVDHKAEGQYTIDRLLLMDGNTPRYGIKTRSMGTSAWFSGPRSGHDNFITMVFVDCVTNKKSRY